MKNKFKFMVLVGLMVASVAAMAVQNYVIGLHSESGQFTMPLASTATIQAHYPGTTIITPNRMLTVSSGYILPATTGADKVVGVAIDGAQLNAVAGGSEVLVNFSAEAVYYFQADSATDVTVDDIGTFVDVGANNTIDGNASTDDIWEVVGIDAMQTISDMEAGYFVKLNQVERL